LCSVQRLYPPSNLLVIDHNPESGSLLIRSLARKFPDAVIRLCKESRAALEIVATQKLDAVVLHRTEEQDAVSLVRTLRSAEPKMVIIAVSGIDRSEQVLTAGATGFLNYESWLMIGQVVANALTSERHDGNPSRTS
jgi:DNA-binding NtrC family response regulator